MVFEGCEVEEWLLLGLLVEERLVWEGVIDAAILVPAAAG